MYRIRIRNIRLIERNDEIVYLDDMVLIDEDNIIFGYSDTVKGLKVGDSVNYFPGVFPKVNYKSIPLMSVLEARINFIIKPNKMEIKPSKYENRILLKQDPNEEIIGGLYIPESVSKKPDQGTIIATSEFYVHETTGGIIAPKVHKGDKVLYMKSGAHPVTVDGEELLIITEGNIFAVTSSNPM